jgi:flagellar hook-basal body complex protein FliE
MIPPVSGSTLSIGALSPNATIGVRAPGGTTTGAGDQFGDAIAKALGSVESTQATADTYSRQAATGSLERVEDFMVASTEAQLTTQLTVAVRNKAVEAFQEIMRMTV